MRNVKKIELQLLIIVCLLGISFSLILAEPRPNAKIKQGESLLSGIDFATIKFSLEKNGKMRQLASVHIERQDEVVFTGEKNAYLSFNLGAGKMNIAYHKKQDDLLQIPLDNGKLPKKITLPILTDASYLQEAEKQILLKPQANDYIAIELRDPQGQILSITNYFLHVD